MRRQVTKLKYFHGDTELEGVRWFAVGHDGKPGGYAKLYGQNNAQYGTPLGVSFRDALATGAASLTYDPHMGNRIDWLRVERTIKYRASASPHTCDWRCMGAFKHSECRCECGGRNHGIQGRECAAA